MSHANLDDREIVQRGKAIYENQIRPKIETQENIGKIISIDIETCDYEIDSDLLVNLPVKIVIIQIVSWEQNHPMLTLDQLISEETALPDTAKAILLDKILESMT
ncbi:hypothetical protein [Microcoleus vaginatus]|uniref:hypothetical protein n=1 Tax=Microcoleus vaginatus TaxID=119532 RepID=UPI0032AAA4C9